LELVERLHAKSEVNFTQRVRGAAGDVRVAFEREVKVRGGEKGEMELPREIHLEIAPFVGTAAAQITARLQFKMLDPEPGLCLWYDMLGIEQVIDESIRDMIVQITTATGIPPYLGSVVFH
jgi:uncharacterized protein YfdQ (DUF2303 family)